MGNTDFTNLWDYFICAEEYENHLKDKHNRTCSFSFNKNFHKPIISQKIFETGFRPTYPNNKEFAICLTHDVDMLFLPKKNIIMQLFINAIKFKPAIFNDIKILLNKNNNKYVSAINRILEVEAKYNAKSCFNFLSLSKQDEDFNYNIKDIDSVFDLIIKAGDEFGIHGGHTAFNDKHILFNEKKKLEDKLDLEIIGYRNHYYKFEIPTTWSILSRSGIKYSTSFAYPDIISYRNGMCHPFIPVNKNTNEFIDILEIPSIINDFTLQNYMNLSTKGALDLCKNKIEEIASLNGAVTLLYHNNELFGIDFYDELLNFCHKNNGWLTSPKELYQWWTNNEYCKQYNSKEQISSL